MAPQGERTPPPPLTRPETPLIVENAPNCNSSPYGFTCRVSRGAPTKRAKCRTPARVMHYIFRKFRPLQINQVCENVRPHGKSSRESAPPWTHGCTRWLFCAASCNLFQRSSTIPRAEPKVTDLRWCSPSCSFLRFSAKIFGFLRRSVVFCGFLRPPNALKFQEKRWTCENLRFFARSCVLGSLSDCHLRSVTLSAPWETATPQALDIPFQPSTQISRSQRRIATNFWFVPVRWLSS